MATFWQTPRETKHVDLPREENEAQMSDPVVLVGIRLRQKD